MTAGKMIGEKRSIPSRVTTGGEQIGAREPTDGPESVGQQAPLSSLLSMQELGLQGDKRWALRRHIEVDATLTDPDGLVFSVNLTNISEEGCAIRTTSRVELARDVIHSLKVTGLGPLPCHLVWLSDNKAGLAFCESLHPAIVQNLVMKSLHARIILRMAQPERFDSRLENLPPFPFD